MLAQCALLPQGVIFSLSARHTHHTTSLLISKSAHSVWLGAEIDSTRAHFTELRVVSRGMRFGSLIAAAAERTFAAAVEFAPCETREANSDCWGRSTLCLIIWRGSLESDMRCTKTLFKRDTLSGIFTRTRRMVLLRTKKFNKRSRISPFCI